METKEKTNLESRLEESIQIRDRKVILLDELIYTINNSFGDLYSGIDKVGYIPNPYSAKLLLKDINKQKEFAFSLREKLKRKNLNGFDLLVIQNALFSLRAQETFLTFFFFNLNPDNSQIIKPKELINKIYLVYAYNQIKNAISDYDYKAEHQYSKLLSPLHKLLLDSKRLDLMIKTQEQIPQIKKILQEFFSSSKFIPISYNFKIVLTPPEEGSSWEGETRTLSLDPDSFWWYMDNGKEKPIILPFLFNGAHELGHATHERFSRIFPKSIQANEVNHQNLVSMPLTEGIAVRISYDFLDYIKKNRQRYGIKQRDIKLVRLSEKNEYLNELFDCLTALRNAELPPSQKELEELKLHKNYCLIVNKTYNRKKLNKRIYDPSYIIGINHLDYILRKIEKEYGKTILKDPIVKRIIYMGAWHPTVHKLWIDYALKSIGYEKRNSASNHKA